MFYYEQQVLNEFKVNTIAGVDEAGRGPLAGPVAAAAIILPLDGSFSLQVNDSKVLNTAEREKIAVQLQTDLRLKFAIYSCSAERIDQINILQATHEAMRNAVNLLSPLVDFSLVDGLKVADFPTNARFIVKGDALSASIAAASILVKSWRDQYMLELDRLYPEYGFAQNKGYGTREHLEALSKYGPCPEHRKSFAPVRELLHSGKKQLSFPFRE